MLLLFWLLLLHDGVDIGFGANVVAAAQLGVKILFAPIDLSAIGTRQWTVVLFSLNRCSVT